MQTEAAHALVALVAHVHLVPDELPRAFALVMNEGRFECRQLVHFQHNNCLI